jgi:hypothetical protein
MRKISQILESQKDKLVLERIETRDDLNKFAHQALSNKPGYSQESANMMVENLLANYPGNLQKVAQEIENFRKNG